MQLKTAIPDIYLQLSKANKDREKLFKAYVKGYVALAHPGWEVVRIEGMMAILERKGEV
jgi:hypothetical protein